MSEWSFEVSAGQDLIGENLNFTPLSVFVDNMSNGWLYLPDAGRYVPPYSMGWVIPLFHAMGGYAKWQNPPNTVIIPTYAYSGSAHLVFTDAPVAYVAGSFLEQPAVMTGSGAAASASINITPPTVLYNGWCFYAGGAYIPHITGMDFHFYGNVIGATGALMFRFTTQAESKVVWEGTLVTGYQMASIEFAREFVGTRGDYLNYNYNFANPVGGVAATNVRYYLT